MIYALPDFGGGGVILVTADPKYPCVVITDWSSREIDEQLEDIPHQTVHVEPIDPRIKTYSPDERYYVKAGEIYDAQTDELVAYADKQVWVGSVLGWAYDSSGVYIQYSGGSVDESAANPESPIYKLLVPGATPRGTPVPVYTPTPASDGRVPAAGQDGGGMIVSSATSSLAARTAVFHTQSSAKPGPRPSQGVWGAIGVVGLAGVTSLLVWRRRRGHWWVAAAEPATGEGQTRSRSGSAVALTLPAVLVAVQTSRRRRAGYMAALGVPVVLVCVISLACLWRGCVYPLTPAGKRAAVEARWARADAVDEVIGGQVEVVVPARTGIGAALLSPDGRWLAWGVVQNRTDITAEGGPYLTDLSTGQQYEIPTEVGMSRWVNAEYLYLGGKLLHVPDRAIRELELRPAEMLTETFRTVREVYALVDGSEVFLSIDPATPYKVSYPDYYQSKETLPFSYTVVPEPWVNYHGPVTSPDGSLVAVWAKHPKHPEWYLEIQTPAGDVVASVYKRAWVPNIMGWGPDSRTLYFYETTTGASSSIYWPERPVLKLVVDYPPATPTPASEGRIPGAGQLRPVAYRPAPVAQSGEQGWYVDDVSVFDAASSPYIFADDFDRPDSTDLGPDWVEEAGDWNIVSGQLHCPVTRSGCRVATAKSFDDTAFVIETRLRATGNFITPWKLEWFAGDTGYYVWYWPFYLLQPPPPISTGKEGVQPLSPGPRAATLSLVRMTGGRFEVLDQTGVPSWVQEPTAWRKLKVVREASTGLIEVYADEGSGYPATPLLQATDSTFPQLGRLGWWAGGGPGHFYVDWVTVTPGGAP